ncbi:cbb3-type cytochrome oxidase subunit 3 [Phytopseudomonas dryadis]|uniref:CcoQ/FixQ family Cbb3-type cytochrome c oxidase assembly chaperone n=1 Tax=Phytopseudomonas dryadis TaxID=2487520 RepID=A0A4Q9QUG4_9GAMM|nr:MULTISPECIES: CcoQ/FixQ family Cbb3-type cytochrome c oxidase assembly chaperone [Pseudomonas]TBU86212.1 CcoQ/FixQ family Cbb3-type cytochrome c oxidase assembly chaperone [Pseudomonas dryadis]TBV01538.1 CcoQ/FixQ family Cbb3-type cytochrome c oxidase assembly chaperone [Pseudomonas dryadis]TBV19630.1 CcoQ/FixQ family Cbb3-type cytochrome c oxidase assembly chaperone [Pseudomonas sp. FRB 230]
MPAFLTDIGTIRGIGTLVVFIAFVAVVLWAYSSKRKSSFDDAANLPFADEPKPTDTDDEDRDPR